MNVKRIQKFIAEELDINTLEFGSIEKCFVGRLIKASDMLWYCKSLPPDAIPVDEWLSKNIVNKSTYERIKYYDLTSEDLITLSDTFEVGDDETNNTIQDGVDAVRSFLIMEAEKQEK